MSLTGKEAIATAAMQAQLSNPYLMESLLKNHKKGDAPIADFIAELSFAYADAMINESWKRKDKK
jgi:hypothetical protein